ncbi:MAG: S-layer homology domain-containing protein [Paenibacillaceae bacterium]
MIKKLALIAIIMNLLLLPLVSHAETITSESKAAALNKLTILQGNGVDFNLGGQLKRSEAITFIIRILAKEGFVKNNTAFYQRTTFNDVKETDWYAPYVGYSAEQGIVNGYPDGGYHPEASVSEKEFLKLILSALGYKVDVDFVWDTIYESAYNLGIVKDVKYQTQKEDNKHYTRSDVVDALYGVLTIPLKGTKKTIMDTLLDANIVDHATAVQLGFAKDIVLASIQSVNTANGVTLTVKMSKAVQTLADKDVTIYETDNKANVLNASVTSQVYGDLIINTSKQIPDKKYTIEISNSVEGSQAPAVATSSFTGHKILEVKSVYFKISKIVPISKNRINVYFTQPITSEIALPIYYKIFKNDASFIEGSRITMDVKVLAGQNNAIGLYLKDGTIIDDMAYSLKVSGDTISSYGVLLNNGLGDSMAFSHNLQENEALKVNQLVALDSKTVRMEFNQELDLATVNQTSNYKVASTTGIPVFLNSVSIPSDGNNKALLLNISGTIDRTLNYQITTNNLSDLFNLDTMSEVINGFVGKPTTEVKDLRVSLAAAIDKLTIQVYMDKKVDVNSASISSNYMITGVTDPNFIAFPTKVYVNPLDSTQIKLYFAAGKEMINTSKYKLKVFKLLMDEQGNASSADIVTEAFNGSSEAYVKPIILEAIVIGKDTVRIKTSKELSLSGSNLALSNYTLELREGKNTVTLKTPTSVAAIDETTLIIHFDNLDVTKGYSFKFNTLTDYSGNNIRGSADGTTSVLLKNGDTP